MLFIHVHFLQKPYIFYQSLLLSTVVLNNIYIYIYVYACMYMYIYISLSTVVLNSSDQPENKWLPKECTYINISIKIRIQTS